MTDQEIVLKKEIEGNVLTISGSYSKRLDRKSVKNVSKNLLKILIDEKKKSIEKFGNSIIRLGILLKRSEKNYKKLSFTKDTKSANSLREKDKTLSTFLDTYERNELIEDPRQIKEAAQKRRERIKVELEKEISEQVKANANIKNQYIEREWQEYETLFGDSPNLLVEVEKGMKEYFGMKSLIKLDLKKHFIRFVKIRPSIIKSLQERDREKKQKFVGVLENIRLKGMGENRLDLLCPEMKKFSFLNFFSYILLNSHLVSKDLKDSFSLKFDIMEAYKNFFTLFIKRDSKLEKEWKLEKDNFIQCPIRVDTIHKIKRELDKISKTLFMSKEVVFKQRIIPPKPIPKKTSGKRKRERETSEKKIESIVKRRSKILVRLDFQEIIELVLIKFSTGKQEVLESDFGKKVSTKFKQNMFQKYQLKIIVPITVIVLAVSLIFGTLILGFIFSNVTPNYIQKDDRVQINYTTWESDKDENYDVLNPVFDAIIWIRVIPITENETTGQILGLYNNLLGKKIYHESGLVWLNRCIDGNRDGIDDVTGAEALTYGNFSDLYYDTCLMIEFRVLIIEKVTETVQPFNSDILRITMTTIIIVIIITAGGILIGVVGASIKKWRNKNRIEPKVRSSDKELVLKYGMLIAILSFSAYVVLIIFNSEFPLTEISLLLQHYPSTLTLLIVLIVVIWISLIPIYLFLFGLVKRRRKKQ